VLLSLETLEMLEPPLETVETHDSETLLLDTVDATLMWMGWTKLFHYFVFSVSVDNKHLFPHSFYKQWDSKSRTKVEASANIEFVNNLEAKCGCLFVKLMTDGRQLHSKKGNRIERLAFFKATVIMSQEMKEWTTLLKTAAGLFFIRMGDVGMLKLAQVSSTSMDCESQIVGQKS